MAKDTHHQEFMVVASDRSMLFFCVQGNTGEVKETGQSGFIFHLPTHFPHDFTQGAKPSQDPGSLFMKWE